ncbi:MAG: DNA starvation/stationary phase protection protein [Candidatus Izemoplasmatales bacterium]|nr:DNA starvation/stationary phase protection protein [Candidatus Izemoplasmatales bacterium]MDY0138706.1 DNA starvation/stationary phase protection protein [Candidatus Izemoplasmatales bacterium]
MNEQITKLNEYLADLGVLNVKLHNLHWNVKGHGFKQAHVNIEEMYDDLFEKFDEVAERIKMLGDFPKASLKSYLESTNIKELESKNYEVKESYELILSDYLELRNAAINIRTIADKLDDFSTVAMMEDHIIGYNKQIWFLESDLK